MAKAKKHHRPATVTRCDFCAAPHPVWAYPLQHARLAPNQARLHIDKADRANRNEEYACAECAQLIDAGQTDAIVLRSVEAARKMYGGYQPSYDAVLQETDANIESFMLSHGPRRWIGQGPPPRQELPALPDVGPYSEALLAQLRLRDWWRPRTWRVDATQDSYRYSPQHRRWEEDGQVRRGFAHALAIAETYYLEPQIAHFLYESSRTIPDHATWAPDDLPCAVGFLYLGEALPVGQGARLRALAWHYQPPTTSAGSVDVVVDPSLAPGEERIEIMDEAEDGPVVDLGHTMLVQLYDEADFATTRSARLPFRDAFTWDHDAPIKLEPDPARRLLLACWTFIQQKVAVEAARPANSLGRKTIARELAAQPSDVERPIRIVYLRREERGVSATRESAGTRQWHHRWWRGLHKRHVRYGPMKGVDKEDRPTRLVWIPPRIITPHVPGADQLPIKPSKAIYVVAR
jgi:hypothetical protein